jgi:hypothetical protein
VKPVPLDGNCSLGPSKVRFLCLADNAVRRALASVIESRDISAMAGSGAEACPDAASRESPILFAGHHPANSETEDKERQQAVDQERLPLVPLPKVGPGEGQDENRCDPVHIMR